MYTVLARFQESIDNLLSTYNISIPGNLGLAVLIAVLTFVLFLTLSLTRRHFLNYSIKGAGFGVLIGFLFALILEGFLLIGVRTAFTEVLGWKNPPRPIAFILNIGNKRLEQVLGAQIQVPSSQASLSQPDSVLESFDSLNDKQKSQLREQICK